MLVSIIFILHISTYLVINQAMLLKNQVEILSHGGTTTLFALHQE